VASNGAKHNHMPEPNPNHRLEMFCDGVFAIAITLLIIEIKVPPVETIHTLPIVACCGAPLAFLFGIPG
jgi:uncharacterized membrane protein